MMRDVEEKDIITSELVEKSVHFLHENEEDCE